MLANKNDIVLASKNKIVILHLMDPDTPPPHTMQSLGGIARAAKLNEQERKDIAERAGKARWAKEKPQSQLDGQLLLNIEMIPHEVEGVLIPQRMVDGYVNATAMCKAVGKLFGHYNALKSTQEFLAELASDIGIPISSLVVVIKGGNAFEQGTWVHPDVAINLGQWCSPKFAVAVAKWVREWMTGKFTVKGELPYHIRRYLANRSEIPSTHWSMLNELTFAIIGPLEKEGYTLPERMVPDISEGKMFCNWLRKALEIDPKTFPSYRHTYEDGRIVMARLYPNQLLPAFREHLHQVWIPQRMVGYFQERDPKALPYIAKSRLLLESSNVALIATKP